MLIFFIFINIFYNCFINILVGPKDYSDKR